MADTFTSTQTIWFGDRIKGWLKNIVGWIVLVIAAILVIYRNEWRALQTTQSRNEVASQVISIPSDTVDANNEGKIVHTYGDVHTSQTVGDVSFGISPLSGTIALQRVVEMYQRHEKSQTKTRDKVGGSQEQVTTYSYKKDRSDTVIDSSRFAESSEHNNPVEMLYQWLEDRVQEATLWAFTLSDSQIDAMSTSKKFAYTQSMFDTLPAALKGKASIHNDMLYIGNKDKVAVENPAIGDYRISWSVVPVGTVSIIAQQSDKSFRPYQTKAGDSIDSLTNGNVSAEMMIADAQKSNQVLTWMIRIGGIVAIIMGLSMLMSLIRIVASILPFLGRIADASIGLIAVVVWLAIGILTIAIARIAARPVIGISLLVCVAWLIVGLFMIKKKKATDTSSLAS